MYCCCCSVSKSCPTTCNPWTAACQVPLPSTLSQSLLKFMSTESVMLSNHLILCHPPSSCAFNLSRHQDLFQWVDSSHQVAKVLEPHSASSSVLPMNVQGWFSLGLTGLISLQSRGLSRVFSSITNQKYLFLLVWPKSSFSFACKVLLTNLNELFGQPNSSSSFLLRIQDKLQFE